jgi:hypothetical protein
MVVVNAYQDPTVSAEGRRSEPRLDPSAKLTSFSVILAAFCAVCACHKQRFAFHEPVASTKAIKRIQNQSTEKLC